MTIKSCISKRLKKEINKKGIIFGFTCAEEPTARGSSPLALRLTFTPSANAFAKRASFIVPCT
jgi:Zn-dependent M28 family amino/carboxypeptidase